MKRTDLRAIPSVDALLRAPAGQVLSDAYGHDLWVEALRQVLDEARALAKEGKGVPADELLIRQASRRAHHWTRPSLVPVINATGIILHTNLGRAPLSAETTAAMDEVSRSYNKIGRAHV